jgi:hypothetical protein
VWPIYTNTTHSPCSNTGRCDPTGRGYSVGRGVVVIGAIFRRFTILGVGIDWRRGLPGCEKIAVASAIK